MSVVKVDKFKRNKGDSAIVNLDTEIAENQDVPQPMYNNQNDSLRRLKSKKSKSEVLTSVKPNVKTQSEKKTAGTSLSLEKTFAYGQRT